MRIFMKSYGMPILVLSSILLGGFIRMILFYSFVCALAALGMGASGSLMEFTGGSITKPGCQLTIALVQSTSHDFF